MISTYVSSASQTVTIGANSPTVLVGERINPAGKKAIAEALRNGNLELLQMEALAQVRAGADILDVNVSLFGAAEKELLPQVVKAVAECVEVPLCLDSAKADALAAGLSVYRGKALVNSVSGEERSLKGVLPLVKEYGAAVIGLLQDDRGIPRHADGRLRIAQTIIDRAERVGIAREDVLIDCMVGAVAADPAAGRVLLETIRRVKSEIGVNIALGVSNISFGLPRRDLLNNCLVAAAVVEGATCLIADAEKIRASALASDLILGHDVLARRYLGAYRYEGDQQR